MYYTLEESIKMKHIRFILLGLLLSVLIASCGGGAPSESASPTQVQTLAAPTDRPPVLSHVAPASLPPICNCVLRFDHISIEDGLSQSSVQVIFQDSLGFLWFGTQDGL